MFNADEIDLIYKNIGRQTYIGPRASWLTKNVLTEGFWEPNPVFPLGAIVQYSLIQCLQ